MLFRYEQYRTAVKVEVVYLGILEIRGRLEVGWALEDSVSLLHFKSLSRKLGISNAGKPPQSGTRTLDDEREA